MVLQDTWLFHGTIRENIAYGRPGAIGGRHRGGRRGGPRRPLRAHPAGRLRHGHRRRRQQPVGRREAAPDHRPGVPGRSADPHPRRGHVVGRHADRDAHPAGHAGPHARAHGVRHRPSPVDHPRRRHHPGHGPRLDRRAGRPTTRCSAAAASTRTCTRASSRPPWPRRAERCSVDADHDRTHERRGRARRRCTPGPTADDRLVLVASQGGKPDDPAWAFNLRAEPRCVVSAGKRRRSTVRATEVPDGAGARPAVGARRPGRSRCTARTRGRPSG